MQTQDNQFAGFPANKNQADPVQPSFNKNQAGFVLPPYQGVTLLDPSIIYSIQLTNAAADAILRMGRVLAAVEPDKFCGYADTIEGYGCAVTDIVDHLIDFAGHFAKASL